MSTKQRAKRTATSPAATPAPSPAVMPTAATPTTPPSPTAAERAEAAAKIQAFADRLEREGFNRATHQAAADLLPSLPLKDWHTARRAWHQQAIAEVAGEDEALLLGERLAARNADPLVSTIDALFKLLGRIALVLPEEQRREYGLPPALGPTDLADTVKLLRLNAAALLDPAAPTPTAAADLAGKPPAGPDPHAPLTDPEREVLNLIQKQKTGTGIQGKAILTQLAGRGIVIEESDFRGRIITRLKADHGVKNRRGVGYYCPPKIEATKTQH